MLPVPPRAPGQPGRTCHESACRRAAEVRFWIVFVVLAPALGALACVDERSQGAFIALGVAIAVAVRFRKGLSPGRLPVRWRSRLAAFFALGLLGYGMWLYRSSHPNGITAIAGARWVEVQLYPGDEVPARPGATSGDPEAIADVVAVLAKTERVRPHKCGPCGLITFRHTSGLVTEMEFQPGHDPEWYEVEFERRLYRVPRAEFVAAMKRIGAEVPLTCP
ncbi:MAG: hypothetical protein J0I06_24360 [Planctomycetes bacterium]|nr:hypothetical protein [Planctomycetota bacterium]